MAHGLLFFLALLLPPSAVYIWYRIALIPVNLRWFLALLGGGVIALALAAFIQYIIFLYIKIDNVFFLIFFRTAFVEEASRLIVFLALYAALKRFPSSLFWNGRFAAAAGLVSALSFGALESAWYTLESPPLVILRLVTSVPLHAACASRTALAARCLAAPFKNSDGAPFKHLEAAPFKNSDGAPPPPPARGLPVFLKAVFLHGFYNYFVSAQGWTVYIAPFLVLSAFISQAVYISSAERLDEDSL